MKMTLEHDGLKIVAEMDESTTWSELLGTCIKMLEMQYGYNFSGEGIVDALEDREIIRSREDIWTEGFSDAIDQLRNDLVEHGLDIDSDGTVSKRGSGEYKIRQHHEHGRHVDLAFQDRLASEGGAGREADMGESGSDPALETRICTAPNSWSNY